MVCFCVTLYITMICMSRHFVTVANTFEAVFLRTFIIILFLFIVYRVQYILAIINKIT